MRIQTAEVFHDLMKNGWIDRAENPAAWGYADDIEVQEELEVLKDILGFEIIRSTDRIYLVPTQDNDLFLKNNIDYRKDIKAENNIRMKDLYLYNYLAIYIIFLFFNGEGNDPQCREFIKKEDLIQLFTQHCQTVLNNSTGSENDYSENFKQLANAWLSKTEGTTDSAKSEQKYGMVNKILRKFDTDKLFYQSDDDRIYPTRKMKDLIPYFLRKDRITEIQNWIKGEEENASDK